jgi:sugar lactone lactonase YvrE
MISGDIYTISARGWHNPADVAVDASGNVLVTDRFNDQVKVIAAKAGRFYGRALRAGQVVVIAGVGKAGYGGDGGVATKAKLNQPTGIALDHSGNIVITDSFNGRVRVIAVKAGRFYGQTMKAGHIYTVARLACYWVAVDASGNLVLADQFFLRVVAERSGPFYGVKMAPGLVYTIAGGGSAGSPGDGGPATSAYVAPNGIAFDATGNILIADSRNGRIRVIAVRSGSFYGQAMKAQDIYTIAGGGPAGLNDGGRAIAASLNSPTGVAVAPGGKILFADNQRIRRISN